MRYCYQQPPHDTGEERGTEKYILGPSLSGHVGEHDARQASEVPWVRSLPHKGLGCPPAMVPNNPYFSRKKKQNT